jgi:hypothetical protein
MGKSSAGRIIKNGLIGFSLALCLAVPASAEIKTSTVNFSRGKTSTTLIGNLKGDLTRDYVVSGKAGETLSVTMTTSNKSAYFNILPPGSTDEAIFIGSTSGNSFRGALSDTGAYKVRVYLMRNAARQNQSAVFTLKIGLSGTSSMSGDSGGGKANISDLAGMNDIRAIDVMAERGFKDVDSFEQGNGRYGIFYRPSSRQCVQMIFVNGKVENASDIGTHPKCQ